MRARWIVLGVMAWASSAHAEETAPAEDPLLASELRTARDAATHGHCDIALRIGARIRELDVAFYEARFAVDVPIAACLAGTAPPRPAPPPALVAPVDIGPSEHAVPPLSPARVAGEVLLGTALGIGAGIGGLYLGVALDCANGCPGEFGGLGAGLLGGAAGMVVGSSLGVYVVGASGDETGAFGAALFGSLLGGLGSLALVAVDNDRLAVLGLAAPAIGATWAFNMTRRYDRRSALPSVVPTASTQAGVTTLGLAGTF